jgi:hypothetical protein
VSTTAVLAEPHRPTDDSRRCPICGADMTDLASSALTCSPKCGRKRARVLRLLAGEADGPYATFEEYENRRQRGCKEPAKRRPVSRTDVARRFLADFVMQVPGEMVPAESIRAAYLRWHQALAGGEMPLGRAAFDELVRRTELAEDIVGERTGSRGRPRTVFVGIRLADPPDLP